jgi:hypothetical protein
MELCNILASADLLFSAEVFYTVLWEATLINGHFLDAVWLLTNLFGHTAAQCGIFNQLESLGMQVSNREQ